MLELFNKRIPLSLVVFRSPVIIKVIQNLYTSCIALECNQAVAETNVPSKLFSKPPRVLSQYILRDGIHKTNQGHSFVQALLVDPLFSMSTYDTIRPVS